MTGWHIRPMGEAALLVECDADDVDAANRWALALADALAGDFDALPAIRSVLITFDPCACSQAEVEARVRARAAQLTLPADAHAHIVTLPTRFGGEHGPDLPATAQALGLTPEAVIHRLTARPYRVLMIGFAPGFPYIGPLPAELTLPRRSTPRPAVPAGSVAIAAGMVGIYPARLPGGWHIIGHTDIPLFDPTREPPALLRAGDWVQFADLGSSA